MADDSPVREKAAHGDSSRHEDDLDQRTKTFSARMSVRAAWLGVATAVIACGWNVPVTVLKPETADTLCRVFSVGCPAVADSRPTPGPETAKPATPQIETVPNPDVEAGAANGYCVPKPDTIPGARHAAFRYEKWPVGQTMTVKLKAKGIKDAVVHTRKLTRTEDTVRIDLRSWVGARTGQIDLWMEGDGGSQCHVKITVTA